MAEEVIEVNNEDISNSSDLFDSAVLDSLNKLTNEIQEDLLTNNSKNADSVISGIDSYDSEEYSDDDDDPDSGENKLFHMMDELVMELQMELKEENPDQELEEDKGRVEDITTQSETTASMHCDASADPISLSEDRFVDAFSYDDSKPTYIEPVVVPPANRTIVGQFSGCERAEKQRRLHLQVKTLLERVSAMAEQSAIDEEKQPATAVSPTAGHGRKRGDSSADKLERLMGVLSSYQTSTSEVRRPTVQSETTSTSSTQQNPAFSSEDQAKMARAVSSYTQRRRREYLLRKQASHEENELGVSLSQRADSATPTLLAPTSSSLAVSPPSSSQKTSCQAHRKKKSKPRTNKHRKGKHKQLTPVGAAHRNQNWQNVYEQQQRHEYYRQSEPLEPIPQQSLRALLSSLLALDEKLSREQLLMV